MDLNKLTQKSQEAMQQAQTKALRYGHVKVDGEHLLLALIAEGSSTAAGRLLQQLRLSREAFLDALTAVRGHQRVTSAMPEVAYEALEKYGIDLVT